MAHSPFPWQLHKQAPTSVFDAIGRKIVSTDQAHVHHEIDEGTVRDNAALIAAIPQMVEALRDLHQKAGTVATWLNHWDVSFADQDEWRGPTGDGQLFFDSLNRAAELLSIFTLKEPRS